MVPRSMLMAILISTADDPMFGKLFYEVRAIWYKRFLKRLMMPAIDGDQVGRKIDDISAATFGRRVYEFLSIKIISKDLFK